MIPTVLRGVVVIGGSAGALPAVTAILARLPRRLGVPVVLILHRGRDSGRQSTLADQLSRAGQVPVTDIEDLDCYSHDRVHLAPSGYHTLIGRTGPVLSSEPRQSHSLPSIDAAFASAADSFGAGATAVTLSCANTDGAAGGRAILESGGRLITVSPASAPYPMLAAAMARLPGAEVLDPDILVAVVADAVAHAV